MNTKEFHELLHGGIQTGVSYIWVNETGRCQYFSPQDSIGVSDFVARNEQNTLYFGLAPTESILAVGKRASRETVSSLVTLAIDIDVEVTGEANPSKPLPKSKSEALSWLKSLPTPIPTLIVDSGRDFHAYLALETPLPLQTEAQKV